MANPTDTTARAVKTPKKRAEDRKHAEQKVATAIAEKRVRGMNEIKKNLELGKGLTAAALSTAVTDLKAMTDRQDQMEVQLATLKDQVKTQTTVVRDLNERVLAGVLSQYGPDSDQYKSVGGTRRSDKKRPVRKAKGTAAPAKPTPAVEPSARAA